MRLECKYEVQAAHQLTAGVPEDHPCRRLHGHRYNITVVLIGDVCHIGRISGRDRVRLVKSWGTDSIDSCVPLWSKENRAAVCMGLLDAPPAFDPPDPEQFLTGWEAL